MSSQGRPTVPADAFRRGLEPAARRLRNRHIRTVFSDAVAAGCRNAAVGLPFAALAVIAGRWAHRPGAIGLAIGGITLIAGGGLIVRTVQAAQMTGPTLAEAAERLDLACGGGNRIASALDLAGAERGPFVHAAIADGIASLQSGQATPPVLPASPALPRFWSGVAAVGMAAFLFACFARLPCSVERALWVARPITPTPVALPGTFARTGRPADDRTTTRSEPETPEKDGGPTAADPHRRPASLVGVAAASTGSTAVGGQGAANAAARADVGSGTGSAAAPGGVPSPAPAPGGPADGNAPGLAPSNPPAPAAAGRDDASSRSDAHSTPKTSGPNSARSAAGSPSPGSSRGDGAAQSSGETQSGQGQQSGPNTPTASSGEGASGSRPGQNGQGQGDGQSPPKKSRGVPPLMQGRRLPDTVSATPRPGPDERTTLGLPPGPQAAESSAVTPLPLGHPVESAAGPYSVSVEDLAAVGRYFQQFHQDGPAGR